MYVYELSCVPEQDSFQLGTQLEKYMLAAHAWYTHTFTNDTLYRKFQTHWYIYHRESRVWI